mmetsp:Transcript_60078/g.169434  ORF Transcript_60078/g.169434 Transcript_60078/m.169434 type:complete len:211 (+) Transcript_60078:363-995(+)
MCGNSFLTCGSARASSVNCWSMPKLPEQKELMISATRPTLWIAAFRSTISSLGRGLPAPYLSGTNSTHTRPAGTGTRQVLWPAPVLTPTCSAPKMAGQTCPRLKPCDTACATRWSSSVASSEASSSACPARSRLCEEECFLIFGLMTSISLSSFSFCPADDSSESSSKQSTLPARKPPMKDAEPSPRPLSKGILCVHLKRRGGNGRPAAR